MNDETTLAELFLGVATSKQREAVISEDNLVVVSAGAGSGKTRTLSWRFAWLVATGSARHDEILTITYTEKAAQEMEDKILSTLNDWLKALETSDIAPKEKKAVAERLTLACNRFDEAQISTIHSFAMNLLKSYGQFLEINQILISLLHNRRIYSMNLPSTPWICSTKIGSLKMRPYRGTKNHGLNFR